MTPFKRLFHNAARKVKRDQENGARKAVLEDLFYDFNRSRVQIYKMNFVRGIVLGAGTVIGGTLVIALLVWVLSLLSNIIPPLGDFFESVSQTLESSKR
jgi:hypothetical protein